MLREAQPRLRILERQAVRPYIPGWIVVLAWIGISAVPLYVGGAIYLGLTLAARFFGG